MSNSNGRIGGRVGTRLQLLKESRLIVVGGPVALALVEQQGAIIGSYNLFLYMVICP